MIWCHSNQLRSRIFQRKHDIFHREGCPGLGDGPFETGTSEFCNLERPCANPDEKCHVFFEKFCGVCGCDKNTTCSYTVDYTYCPDEPTPRVPEPYERVEDFEKCLTRVFIPDKPTPSFCFPATRPNNCPTH